MKGFFSVATRSYSQSCSIAIFLDELGGRWSLLLVRELMLGPRRFKQLLDGLEGIGPNLLTERLSQLQDLNIIQKANREEGVKSGTYILTEAGKELEPILLAMVRWSLKNIPSDDIKRRRRDELLMIAFRACFRPSKDHAFTEEFEFRIGQTNFVLMVDKMQVTSTLGQSTKPAFVFISDSDTFARMVNGDLTMASAEAENLLTVIGDRAAYQRWQSMFTLASCPLY